MSEPKLLLCIEDDADDCTWIEEAASEIDPTIVFVHKANGLEGLTYLKRAREGEELPCLILLDMNMPIMDGRQALKAIKEDPELKNIPIIVFSTSNNKADQLYCDFYGADFITKPDRILELKRKVKQIVVARCA
jgi:CheY-like chemotaxis protein